MTERVNNLKHLQSEIDGALSLIRNNQRIAHDIQVPKSDLLNGTTSLLERCESIVTRDTYKKPILRAINHLACSGGTIFSKCIAALPNVFLLSEAHPNSAIVSADRPKFSPSDIPSLAKFAQIPDVSQFNEHIFAENIKALEKHLTNYGGNLVVRYHSHSDYCTDSPLPKRNAIKTIFESQYKVLQILTIRNPIDAYTSLKRNGWVHFSPQSFDEYCRRYLSHLKHFTNDEIIRYEDLVDSPSEMIGEICNKLNLLFDDSFEDTFNLFNVTGDSGRKSEYISKRSRLASADILKEARASSSYAEICSLGWYELV